MKGKKTYLQVQDQKKLDGKEFLRWVVAQQMSLRDTSRFKTVARSHHEIKTGNLYVFMIFSNIPSCVAPLKKQHSLEKMSFGWHLRGMVH